MSGATKQERKCATCRKHGALRAIKRWTVEKTEEETTKKLGPTFHATVTWGRGSVRVRIKKQKIYI